jgi:hypothetical protein
VTGVLGIAEGAAFAVLCAAAIRAFALVDEGESVLVDVGESALVDVEEFALVDVGEGTWVVSSPSQSSPWLSSAPSLTTTLPELHEEERSAWVLLA